MGLLGTYQGKIKKILKLRFKKKSIHNAHVPRPVF